jgi:polyphosphate kinase
MAEAIEKASADNLAVAAAPAAERAVSMPATDAPDDATRGASARDAKAAVATAAAAVANGDGAAAAANPRPAIDPGLTSPELFLNRELTWLTYDRRVLSEAEDERSPLLERVKFLAISSSNLDEFFMKRIGGLKQQVVAGIHQLTPDGRTPQQQITECYAGVREIERRQR